MIKDERVGCVYNVIVYYDVIDVLDFKGVFNVGLKGNVIFLGRKGVGNVIRLFKNVVFDFV